MGNSSGKPLVLTDEVNLNHFRLLRVVGKGAFGKVRIVERRDTGLTFALKYIRKDEVVRSESVRNIIRERRMLQHLNHPFLCNLRYSFQDMEYLYIVVDLMNGGDLRFHISRKTFTEDAVRFWIAELACALRHIHKQGIVHRDVKPDNVLLDSEGHVHLADFNVASDFTPGKLLSSKSGTLAYLAPEVYGGRGYAAEVDWWSLGVLFYECIYNKRPFEANNSEALANAIIKANPAYPVTQPQVSMVCLHAISSLLEKDKTLRIGAAGFESFTDNPFFREIDFEALERKEVEPVFCPSSDKTNFDATYDLEELLLEEAPLEARARKQKPRAELRDDATAQEIRADELHRMIETMFEPFNYTKMPDERAPLTDAAIAGSASAAAIAAGHNPQTGKKYAKSERDAPTEPSRARKAPENPRSIPTPRSQTPGSTSRTRSSTHSPNGSPPLPTANLSTQFPPSHPAQPSSSPPAGDYTPSPSSERSAPPPPPQPALPSTVRSIRYDETTTHLPPPTTSAPRAPHTSKPSQQTAAQRPRGSHRSTSMGGGVQVVLNEQGSWSGMANQSASMVDGSDKSIGGGPGGLVEKPTGMLGFLGRKKGRDRSPKAKVRERGVLGKEGARVVVGSGRSSRDTNGTARSRAGSNPLPAITAVVRKVRSKSGLRERTPSDEAKPTKGESEKQREKGKADQQKALRKKRFKSELKGETNAAKEVAEKEKMVRRARSKSLLKEAKATKEQVEQERVLREAKSKASLKHETANDGKPKDTNKSVRKARSGIPLKGETAKDGIPKAPENIIRKVRSRPLITDDDDDDDDIPTDREFLDRARKEVLQEVVRNLRSRTNLPDSPEPLSPVQESPIVMRKRRLEAKSKEQLRPVEMSPDGHVVHDLRRMGSKATMKDEATSFKTLRKASSKATLQNEAPRDPTEPQKAVRKMRSFSLFRDKASPEAVPKSEPVDKTVRKAPSKPKPRTTGPQALSPVSSAQKAIRKIRSKPKLADEHSPPATPTPMLALPQVVPRARSKPLLHVEPPTSVQLRQFAHPVAAANPAVSALQWEEPGRKDLYSPGTRSEKASKASKKPPQVPKGPYPRSLVEGEKPQRIKGGLKDMGIF